MLSGRGDLRPCAAPPGRGDFQARAGAGDGLLRGFPLRPGGGELLFGGGQRGAGAGSVNLFGAFGEVRQHDHAVRKHFGKSPADRYAARLPALAIAQGAGGELGEQRRVPRQDAEVAFAAGQIALRPPIRAPRRARA